MPQTDPANTQQHIDTARRDISHYDPPWPTFTAFLAERQDDERIYLHWRPNFGEHHSWTAKQWIEHVHAFAAELARQGVHSGDEVALVATNRPEVLLTAFATWLLGGVFVPLDPRESPQRHGEVIDSCTSVWAATITANPDDPDSGTPASESTRQLQVPQFSDPLPPPRSEIQHSPLTAPALRLHTSGTSGTPKPILLGLRGLLINCAAMRDAFAWGPGTRTMTVLPICHANGLVINSFLPWFAGGSSVLLDRFSTTTFWTVAAETGATTCSLVPTVMEYLLEAQSGKPPTTMREVISGSGPLRPEAATQFEAEFMLPVRQLYGLSETSAVLTVTPPATPGTLTGTQRSSIGPTVPHAEMAILNADGGHCREGERGELVARGGMLMLGYASRPEATAEAFAGGWFHTGDRGYYLAGPDGRAWYYLEGRVRDVVSRGGSTILPQVIDDTLRGHPAVEGAATIGFPHRWYGEEVAAYVVLRQGHQVSDTELRQWCEARVGHDAAPKVIFFGDELPVTAVGKTRRGVLAKELASQLETYWQTRFPALGKEERKS